jgi:hypothetical protein
LATVLGVNPSDVKIKAALLAKIFNPALKPPVTRHSCQGVSMYGH